MPVQPKTITTTMYNTRYHFFTIKISSF